MTITSAIRATLAGAIIVLGVTGESLAHEVVGLPSYYTCQLTRARAFLRSPNPGMAFRDYPLELLDANGTATGEHLVVISLENDSDADARVTAFGFAWAATAGAFELVQLHQSYNALATAQLLNGITVRTGTVGPNDYTVVGSLALTQAPDVAFSIREDIQGVPGFPHTTLRVALVTGNTFSGGNAKAGLANDDVRHVIAFKGVLPSASNNSLPDIETLLNGSYVRFRRIGSDGEGSETGIWRNLLPAIACP